MLPHHACGFVGPADDIALRAGVANHPTILEAVWIPIEEAIGRKLSPEEALKECKSGNSASAVYRYLRRCGKLHLRKQLRHYTASQKRGGNAGKMEWVNRAKSIHEWGFEATASLDMPIAK